MCNALAVFFGWTTLRKAQPCSVQHKHNKSKQCCRSQGRNPVNSKCWNVKLLLGLSLKLTCQPCLTRSLLWAFTAPRKREENDIWKSASKTSHQKQKKDRNPKTEEERETDKCAFEENISRLHGTQADLSLPSNTGPISVDESPRLFEVVA